MAVKVYSHRQWAIRAPEKASRGSVAEQMVSSNAAPCIREEAAARNHVS